MKRLLLLCALLLCVRSAYAQDPYDRAKQDLAVRDTNSAILHFKEAVKAGRKLSESNYYLGAIAYARHRTDEAIGYLQAAVDRDNENADAVGLLGYALLDKKDNAGALTQFRRALKLSPKDVSVSAGFGTALLAVDSVDAAIVQLSRAKESAPDNPSIYVLLGDAYLKQNVFVLGESNYQKAIELEPRNIGTRAKLARVFYREKKYAESIKEWEGVTAIDSTLPEPYLEVGRTYFLAKQYRNAVRPLYKLTQLQPKSVEGWALYARTLFNGEDYGDAIKAAQTSLKLDSTNAEVWRALARSDVKLKDWNGALGAFAGLSRHGKYDKDDLGDYGAALQSVGREDEAVQVLLEAVKEDSTNCDVYFPLGFIYMKRHDYERASSMFEKRIVCDPRSLSTYVNAAACYMALKNWTRCRELLVRSLELKPDFLAGRLYYARYFAQVDSLEKAVGQYDTVLALIGTDIDKHRADAGEAYLQKAQLYFVDKRFERSIETFRKAQSAGIDNFALELMWGQADLQLLDPSGDQEENDRRKADAVQHFRKSLQFDQASAEAHFWLGTGLLLMRKEGDPGNAKLMEEACSEFNKCLRLDPKNENARKAKEHYGCK
ncbi:MAG TPA: tetratricopeptide repeat protein [Bacteroidota bacterium]|nr:tetratricopeptide repeat protein [Bacteroidota bacterium]